MSTLTDAAGAPMAADARANDEMAKLRREVEQLRAEIEGERRERSVVAGQLAWMSEISALLARPLNTQEIVDQVVEPLKQMLQADAAALYIMESDKQHIATWIGGRQQRSEIRLRMGEGIAGWVALHGNTVNVKDAYKDSRFQRTIDTQTGFRTGSVLCQPLRDSQKNILGVVQIMNKRSGYFTVADEMVLSSVASTVAIRLEAAENHAALLDRQLLLTETQNELTARIANLNLLYELQQAIFEADSLDEVVESIGTRLGRTFSCKAVGLTLVDGGKTSEYAWVENPQSASGFQGGPRIWDTSVRDEVMLTGRETLINSPSMLSMTVGEYSTQPEPRFQGVNVASMLAVPLMDNDRIIGAIELVNRRRTLNYGSQRAFSQPEITVLKLVAGTIGALVARTIARRHAQIEDRLAAMGRMMSGVIHDLKTPLAIASGYVQLMTRSNDPEQRGRYELQVRSQFDHITRMTRELLAYARGENEVFVRTIHMHAFIQEIEEQLTHEFAGYPIKLKVIGDYRGDARFDDGKFKRVIFNLARNAREAMPGGGDYTIRFTREEDTLLMECTDTGVGIEPALQTRIFDAFVSSGKKGNSGLGLAIVKKMVDEHQGSISFTSQPGVGTTFEVRLPLGLGVADSPESESNGAARVSAAS